MQWPGLGMNMPPAWTAFVKQAVSGRFLKNGKIGSYAR